MSNIEKIKESQEMSGVLKNILTYMDKYLDREQNGNANELIINREFEACLDKGTEWEYIEDKNLHIFFLESLIKELATRRGLVFNRNNPTLSCELPAPYLRYRVQAQHKSSLFNSEIALCIRIPSKEQFTAPHP